MDLDRSEIGQPANLLELPEAAYIVCLQIQTLEPRELA